MFLVSRDILVALLVSATMLPASPLRVCSDPNNLPFSNSHSQGFENRIAELLAKDLGRELVYAWVQQRGSFFKVFQAGGCDIVMGVPAHFRLASTSIPYYRSTYVFVARREHAVRSFSDPSLKTSRIGIQVIGANDATVPPAEVLTGRGLGRNIHWYRLYQNYVAPNPPDTLIRAVEHGDVDVAIAWGPPAGYYARTSKQPLVLAAVPHVQNGPPMAFDISVGVRKDDAGLLAQLNAILSRRRTEIRRILLSYGVPGVR